MKTALKFLVGIVILFLVTLSLIFLSEKQIPAIKIKPIQSTTDASGAQAKSVNLSPALEDANSPNSRRSPTPNARDEHEVRNESHKEGSSIFDNVIGFLSLLSAIMLGVAGLYYNHKGLQQNRISNEVQNRAYVTVDGCKVEPISGGMQVKVILKNVGATPATNINLTHWYGGARDYKSALPREGNVAQPMTTGNFMLGPSDKKTFYLPMQGANMPPEMALGFLSGEWSLLFDGELYYDDAFGNTFEVLYHFRKRFEQGSFFGEMNFAENGLKYRKT